MAYLNKANTPLYDEIIYCEGEKDGVLVEVALQHNDGYNENVYSFVNNITTPEGGTHLVGMRSALTKTFNDYARKNKLLKDNEQSLTGEDIREGLTAIVSIKIGSLSLKVRQSRNWATPKQEEPLRVLSATSLVYFLSRIRPSAS